MVDEDAAERVRTATFDYVNSELADLPPDGEDGRRRDEVHGAGRVLATVLQSDLAVLNEMYEEDKSSAAYGQTVINFATGWVPYVGTANGVSELVTGNSAGSLLSPPPDEGEFKDSLHDAEQSMDGSIEGLDHLEGPDFDAITAAMYDIGVESGGG